MRYILILACFAMVGCIFREDVYAIEYTSAHTACAPAGGLSRLHAERTAHGSTITSTVWAKCSNGYDIRIVFDWPEGVER